MALSGSFLRTTVGRRLFVRFLLAAFVPTVLTAGIAWYAVQRQMRADVEARVTSEAKMAGLNTLGNLTRLGTLLRANAGAWPALAPVDAAAGFGAYEVRSMADGFPGGPRGGDRRPLSEEQRAHLAKDNPLLTALEHDGRWNVWMAHRMPSAGSEAVLWGRVSDRALWDATLEAIGGDGTQLCVVELQRGQPLYCDAPLPQETLDALRDSRGEGRIALVERPDASGSSFSASWNAFLRFEYASPDWAIIVTERGDAIFGTLRRFVTTLAGVSLLALLVVFLLSHAQIRRSTEPLEQLQDGTRRLAAGDFSTQVTIRSGDEFSHLADSFNGMAQTLSRQIVTLRSLDALHEAILGAREIPPLLETALRRFAALVPAADVLVAIDQPGHGTQACLQRSRAGEPIRLTIDLQDAHRAELAARPVMRTFAAHEAPPYLAVDPFSTGSRVSHLCPLVLEGRLLGFVVLATPSSSTLGQDLLDAVRRLADRLTLAIVDVQLVQHLAALSEGTLTAFARAIDANSPWTAGHSERVTAAGLIIGTRLGLSAEELRDLRCGGLLHDIGKIGVPPQVLDKAAPLNEAERRIIERHPVLGAEILAPIDAFERAVPIVRSHHEKMNGSGYPDGLVGEQIPYLARILTVADVFDALVSDRPYRSGLGVPRAVEIIQRGARSHFDPDAVSAFLNAVRAGEIQEAVATDAAAGKDLANSVGAGRRAMEDAA